MSANDKDAVTECEPDHAGAEQTCLERGLAQEWVRRKWELLDDFRPDKFGLFDPCPSCQQETCVIEMLSFPFCLA